MADLTLVLNNCGPSSMLCLPSVRVCGRQPEPGQCARYRRYLHLGTGDQLLLHGHNGLMLLSKTPSPTPTSCCPFLTVRGILYGEVAGVGIACSHLTGTLEEPVYSGAYDSYAAENAAHVDQIIAYVDGKRMGTPAVIAGDFNTGPAVGDSIAADLPENFAKFEAAGWTDVSRESGAPLCTSSEPLSTRSLTPCSITSCSRTRPLDYARILDALFEITKEDGTALTVRLSNHCRLRATLSQTSPDESRTRVSLPGLCPRLNGEVKPATGRHGHSDRRSLPHDRGPLLGPSVLRRDIHGGVVP